MRYVLLFIIYLLLITFYLHKKNKDNYHFFEMFALIFGAHFTIAFFGLIIFIFYYFW